MTPPVRALSRNSGDPADSLAGLRDRLYTTRSSDM